MASFDENGKYIKTNWKAGDKITATKLNKIEESIEAVNDNDISRHVEADARLDALEAKNTAQDKELTNVKNLIEDAKDAAELGDYEINSRMQFLEEDVEQAVNDMNNAVTTMRNEMNAHTNTVNTNVNNKISAFETEFDAEVAGLKAVDETIQNDVSEIQNDVSEIQNDISEIQNDMESPQTQSFTVTDAYKFTVDHDGMMPSLVTLDNIEGLSSVETNSKGDKEIVSRSVNHICTIDKSKNYFDDAVLDTIHGDTTTATRENNDITVISSAQYGAVAYSIPNLEEGKKYCILCDDIIITKGDAHFQAATPVEYKPLRSTIDLKFSHNNAVFIGNEICTVTFHCSRVSNSGNVTYKNIQIYEVKEMIVPDIQLNSLPNGVCDEIKDGVYIKRVSDSISLDMLDWKASSMNANATSTQNYFIYYASVSDLRLARSGSQITNQTLCNVLPNVTYQSTINLTSEGVTGISPHIEMNELRIKVPKAECPDVASLRTWFTNNNATFIYELATPIYKDVSTSIKVDKGDTVVVNTCKTMDLTYDIQLNARAQIDALQESLQYSDQQNRMLIDDIISGNVIHDKLITNNGLTVMTNDANVTLGWSSDNYPRIRIGGSNTELVTKGFKIQTSGDKDLFFVDYTGTTYVAGHRPLYNASNDLGNNDLRWRYIYLNNNPNVSSDRSLKENIEYVGKAKSGLTYEELYNFVKDDLGLATYNFIGQDKLQMNFIAQDLLVNADGTDNKVGQMIVNPVPVPTEEEIAEGKPYPTLSYDMGMYTSVLAGALKEAINKIEQLEARINELENK